MLILLLGAFLGGYYLGNRPDSPDVFGKARGVCDGAVEYWRKISAYARGESDEYIDDHRPEEVSVRVEGREYRIGRKSRADFDRDE